MDDRVTQNTVEYPENQRPDLIIPSEYKSYRYVIGKKGVNPLIVICMNPSAARDGKSDRTINQIITISQRLAYDGWIVFNIYPERATDAAKLNNYNKKLARNNLNILREYIIRHEIKEAWGAWGDLRCEALRRGKGDVLSLLKDLDVCVFYFGTLTASGNPRHPLQQPIHVHIHIEIVKGLVFSN